MCIPTANLLSPAGLDIVEKAREGVGDSAEMMCQGVWLSIHLANSIPNHIGHDSSATGKVQWPLDQEGGKISLIVLVI